MKIKDNFFYSIEMYKSNTSISLPRDQLVPIEDEVCGPEADSQCSFPGKLSQPYQVGGTLSTAGMYKFMVTLDFELLWWWLKFLTL